MTFEIQFFVCIQESNFLGLRGPRKMEVLLPKFNNQRDALFVNIEYNLVDRLKIFIHSQDEDDIAEYDFNETNDYFIHLHNKPPEWNPRKIFIYIYSSNQRTNSIIESGAYGLKFDGKNRVTKPSIKNFVLVIENEESKYFDQ